MQNPLLLIALLPDPNIQQEVTAFKEECALLFKASHAFNSPPHITLQAPFRWHEERWEELKIALAAFASGQPSFTIELNGFSHFADRVLFVDVQHNESLENLKKGLDVYLLEKIGLQSKSDHPFRPHMTIAHRDLATSIFPAAWLHFSAIIYQRKFLVNDLAILKHTNKKWEIQERFCFG
ncbi:MAG: 2'-5' RNA ligase family protein [Saprospiraceae bacterium]